MSLNLLVQRHVFFLCRYGNFATVTYLELFMWVIHIHMESVHTSERDML